MKPQHIEIARTCLDAAHDGTMSFPEIVGALAGAGFESYLVDYRAATQCFYRPDGGHVGMALHSMEGEVVARFDAAEMARLVRWAQENGPDYSYTAFSAQAKAAGCAGYLVSFLGRRVVYFGRSGETHVEYFPQ